MLLRFQMLCNAASETECECALRTASPFWRGEVEQITWVPFKVMQLRLPLTGVARGSQCTVHDLLPMWTLQIAVRLSCCATFFLGRPYRLCCLGSVT